MAKKFTLREEANALTCFAFRNGFVETLHAGDWSPLLEDPSLSRITNAEMKKLMIEASEKLAQLLVLKETDPEKYWEVIAWQNRDYVSKWVKDEPRPYGAKWHNLTREVRNEETETATDAQGMAK